MKCPQVQCGYFDHRGEPINGEGELALYWVNPWSQQKEKIATFWWPAHPVEATKQVEEWFEEIARRATVDQSDGSGG